MANLSHSIVRSLEQLGIIFQELKLLEHQQTLPRDENNRPFQDNSDFKQKKMKVLQIPKREDIPYMLSPLAQQMLTQQQMENPGDSTLAFDPTNPAAFQKQFVQKETVDQRMNIKQQYYNQVFKPGHILPTMSIEELAE